MPSFRSRYQSTHYILPDGRSINFRNGVYPTRETDPVDAEAVAILRDICRAEARANRAIWEVGPDGQPVAYSGTDAAAPAVLGAHVPPPIGDVQPVAAAVQAERPDAHEPTPPQESARPARPARRRPARST